MSQAIAHELLGASEIAAALGLSQWRSPLEVWLEKTGQAPAFEGNRCTAWGTDLEPALRTWYAREYQVAIWIPPESLTSAEHPFLRATPDGLVLADDQLAPDDPSNWSQGFEAKSVGWRMAHEWGEPGSDEVPTPFLLQAQQNMLVAGVDAWHLVASIGGAPPVVYAIERDDELIAMIIDGGRRFMACVANRVPPAIDGSEAWSRYIAERHPWSTEEYVRARPEDEVLVSRWREVAAQLAELERVEAELKNQIAAAIGEASGMVSSLGRISYRPRRGGPNHAAAFAALADEVGIAEERRAELLAQHQRRDSRPVMAPRSWSR